MRRRHKFLIFYFLALGVMSAISLTPGGTLAVLLITGMALPMLGIPGFLVAASPTLLLYSAALLPLWFALTAPRIRPWLLGPALLIPAVLAVGPALTSREEAHDFADRASASDFTQPAAAKPKTIELIGDDISGIFAYAQAVGDPNASCNDICRQLLFGGEVEWVRMTQVPRQNAGTRLVATRSAIYRIERRDSCPQIYPDGTNIEREVRDRLVSGDCLIMATGDTGSPEAIVNFTTLYFNQNYPARLPENGPKNAIVETVKRLQIESRRDGALVPILRRTEIVARTFVLPFYFGFEMHMQGGYNGPTIGREKTVMNAINLTQVLRETFGYRLAPVAAPVADDPLKIAERILSLPRETGSFSAPQQQVINDVLKPLMYKPALNDNDVKFIQRVIVDERVDSGQIGVTLLDTFRKHRDGLASLIPVAITRLKIHVPERFGHYQSLLGWALADYPAEALRPYRDEIRAVLEQQPDWLTTGLLSRVAELGDDFTGLIAQRLTSKSNTVRQYAAVAICRADPEAWPAIEPIALAHLAQTKNGDRLEDEEGPLMLSLVRFGRKQMVEEMIQKSNLFGKSRVQDRLAKFEPGFAPKRCRDSL